MFSVYYNQNPGSLSPYKIFAYYIKFQPRAADPSGTTYGGDASKVVMHVTYDFKPKKGKKTTGTPLDLVLVGAKE